MKKFLLLSSLVAFVVSGACAQERKSPHETVEGKGVKVTYGRPYKKNREIFGKLEPHGKVWRVGADEATEVTFARDMNFGGKPIKAGTYTMFVIPNEKEWTVILNSQLGQWGAFSYDKNKDKDVLKVNVPVKNLSNAIEQHTIRFDNKNAMIIEWDKTQVTVPISG